MQRIVGVYSSYWVCLYSYKTDYWSDDIMKPSHPDFRNNRSNNTAIAGMLAGMLAAIVLTLIIVVMIL